MFNKRDNEASCNITKELPQPASACGSNMRPLRQFIGHCGPCIKALIMSNLSDDSSDPFVGGRGSKTSCDILASQNFLSGLIESIKISNTS
ncbi:hypothetical protein AVEN_47963-1 [Araneus ventricosus]|uniref:Uncharacterized protein n=1 Tax=Araneus ventricosus TaxID=182803 RepID=A0A4Y2DP63_ARAVE|nr:hypothetical protein AVEN_47963-1 [Araneus ventricosus]